MEQQFIANWKQLIWEYERKSIFALKHDIPQEWTQDEITSYIQKTKAHHRIYASWWMWLFVIWLPILTITIFGCVLLGSLLFVCAHNFGDILGVVYFVPAGIFSSTIALMLVVTLGESFEGSEIYLSKKIAQYGLIISINFVYWPSWLFFWIVIIPFLPLIKLRRLQLKYAQSWKQSFRIAGWRNPQIENERSTQYTNTLDIRVREWYKSLILADQKNKEEIFFPDSYFLNPEPYEYFFWYINPYKALWVLISLPLYSLSIPVLLFVYIFS